MEFLNEYIKSIAYFLIFSAFIGIISPGDKYKNYINLILGLILILIILKPFAGKTDLSRFLPAGLPEFEGAWKEEELEVYKEAREQMISELYTSRLEEQVRELIESETGYQVLEAEVEARPDTGEILQILLTASSTATVEIMEDKSSEIEREIKKILSDFYNLSLDNIHIRVQKKR